MGTVAQLPRATCALTHVRFENKYRTYCAISSRKRVAVKEIMSAAVATSNPVLHELRGKIASLEGAGSRNRSILPFGVPELDAQLPGGGLAFGALHEVAGGGNGAIDGAAAALFIGGIAARTTRQGGLVPDTLRSVLSGARPGRASSRPRHFRRVR